MTNKIENQIRKRIEANGDHQTVQQLCLDGIQINSITPGVKRLLEGCTNLSYLTMNDCQLKSLQHFPHLQNLVAVQLSGNKLIGDDLSKLCNSPEISFLMLDNNLISSFDYLNQLKPLSELEILQIHNNQISESEDYRQKIFELFPSMTIVDYRDRDDNMVDQGNEQQYISEIGSSRLELLQLLNEDGDKNEDSMSNDKTSTDQRNFKRKFSFETSNSPYNSTNHSSDRQNQSSQNSNSSTRPDLKSQSSSSESEDLVRDFKRKMSKKEN